MKRVLGAAVIVFSVIFLLGSQYTIRADSVSWFDTSKQLELKLVEQNVSKPTTTYWNIPCTQVEAGQCAYLSNYGKISQDRTLQLAGTSQWYPIYEQNNLKITDFVVPIPSSNNVVTFNKYMRIYRDLPTNIEPIYKIAPDQGGIYGVNNYKMTILNQARVKYQDGTDLQGIKQNSLSFSTNGRFIALNTGAFQALVNTETGIARKFGVNSIPSGSSTASLSTSLNSDGSVALTSNTFFTDKHVLYDLNNCTTNTTTGIDTCPERNLQTVFKAAVPTYQKVELTRFLTDSTIEVYLSVPTDSGVARIDKYHLSVPGSSETNYEYLGLGDSFASGEGAYNYKATTDVDTNKCHLSLDSYPYLIASQLSYGKAESIACSGAKVKDIFQENDEVLYVDDKPQAQGKDEISFDSEIYNGFLPGYRRQNQFIEKTKPAVITLSIGGNDINFGKKLQYCILTQYSCYNTAEDRQKIFKEIKGQYQRLVDLYQSVKNTNPFTRIYVIGYPRIVKPGGDCANNVRLSAEELQLAEDIETDLNTMIKRASERAGVFYVDTTEAFSGVRLCEDQSWKLAVNGITAGNDKFLPFGLGPLGNETYHPNKLGHVRYKQSILSATNNLTNPMPIPNTSVSEADINSVLVTDGVIDNQLPTPVASSSVAPEYTPPGTNISRTISDVPQFLKPGSTFRVEVHSEPQIIGEATAIGLREISLNAVLPADISPGIHTIHIIGQNINNEPVDFYQMITIVANEQDYDGDGILNTNDTCQYIAPVGVDVDKDGIDDGCDPEIGEPPVVVPDPPAPEPPAPAPITPKERIKLLFIKIIKTIFSFLLTFTRR
jgi:lysophospholipase L1-like esterase